MQFLSLFPEKTKILLKSGENMPMLSDLEGCLTEFVHFLDLLYLSYAFDKFHHCGILGWRTFWPTSIIEEPWKDLSWIRFIVKQKNRNFSYPDIESVRSWCITQLINMILYSESSMRIIVIIWNSKNNST